MSPRPPSRADSHARHLSDYLRVIYRRRWTAGLAFAAVFITGYVNSVNAYPVRRGMTVEQALALAGGISAQGAKNRIEITRTVNGGKKTFKVELADLVKPGDTIKVGRRIV